MERLDKGEITDGLRCEIVSAVCVPWYQMCEYPSKEEYTAVSKQLVQKYPVLKDSTGNGYVSYTHIASGLCVYACVCLCMKVGACVTVVCLAVYLCVCTGEGK